VLALLKVPLTIGPSRNSVDGPVKELLFFNIAAEKPAAQTSGLISRTGAESIIHPLILSDMSALDCRFSSTAP